MPILAKRRPVEHDVLRFRAMTAQGARDVTGPFEAGPIAPFIRRHVEATARGRSLRCVFEDSGVNPALLKELHVRNIDEKVLGSQYEEDSIVIEPSSSHFDLIDPERVERHLDALIGWLRRRVN